MNDEDLGPLLDERPELATRVRRGEVVVGLVLDVMSREPAAWLTDAMALPAGAALPAGGLIHPVVQPHMVFVLGERLGSGAVTATSVMSATRAVYAGLVVAEAPEVHGTSGSSDLRGEQGSGASFVTGQVGVSPQGLDLSLEACLLEIGGRVVASATGAAVGGHPAEAVAQAANALSRQGISMEAGWCVFTGGLTEPFPLQPGHSVTASFTHLGCVTLSGS